MTPAEYIATIRHGATWLPAAGQAYLQLQHEDQSVGPLVLSQSQQCLYSVLMQLRYLGLSAKMVIDKARQIYATTLFLADGVLLGYNAQTPFRHAILTDDLKRTRRLFEVAERFIEKMPSALRRPLSINHQTIELRYLDTDALIETYTARNTQSGRGGTRHYVHFSECAFYANARKLMEAMLASVPDEPGTTVVYETTANGYDAYFYPMWVNAVNYADGLARDFGARDPLDLLFNLSGWGGTEHPHGWWDGSYFPVFIPWGWMKKYRREPRLERLTVDRLSRYERALYEHHGYDLHQLAYRRYKIRTSFSGNPSYYDEDNACTRFRQEYPATWQESFVSSSRGVFDSTTVSLNIARSEGLARRTYVDAAGVVRPEIQPCNIRWVPAQQPRYSVSGAVTNRGQYGVRASRAQGGPLLVWKTVPKDNEWEHRYIIGADISEGLEQRDYSVAAVLDCVQWEFVAMMRVHMPPLEFAEALVQLAVMYDNAYIMGEYNSYGPTVVPRILSLYDNVCRRPDEQKGAGNADASGYWMRTNERTKVLLVSELEHAIREKPSMFPFAQFWTETATFVRNPKGGGRMGAEGKDKDPGSAAFDDTLIAHGEALVGTRYAPAPYRRELRTRYKHTFAAQRAAANREERIISVVQTRAADQRSV